MKNVLNIAAGVVRGMVIGLVLVMIFLVGACLYEAATADVVVELTDVSFSLKDGIEYQYSTHKDMSNATVYNKVINLASNLGVENLLEGEWAE